jgi:hypothetical protein
MNNEDIVVTIAIQMHGSVVELDIQDNIFDNVRLFSKAGEFNDTFTNILCDIGVLQKVNKFFQHNLNAPTLNTLEDYISYYQPEYSRFLTRNRVVDQVNLQNISRLFPQVTIDKVFSMDESIFEQMGIYLVSIHRIHSLNSLEYLYPATAKNPSLLKLVELERIADFFGKKMPRLYSNELLDEKYEKQQQNIARSSKYSEQEKQILSENTRSNYYKYLQDWDIELSKNGQTIKSIRMSTLVKLIRHIVGQECKINLLDYSCNSITGILPKHKLPYAQYLQPPDIENQITVNKDYGGAVRRKNIKKM